MVTFTLRSSVFVALSLMVERIDELQTRDENVISWETNKMFVLPKLSEDGKLIEN
jgi:hypothetical protein